MARTRSPLADVPIVDGHCHPPLRPPPPAPAAESRAWLLERFTESRDPRQVRDHVPHTLYFQRALRDLAAFYDCAPELDAVMAARQALAPAELLRRCVERGGVGALVVDGGYRAADSYSVGELNALLPPPCRAWPLLRVEPLLEDLIAASPSFAALEKDFALALADLRGASYVGLKTIVAYRSGLALGRPDRQAAAAAFPALRAAARAGARRLSNKPLLDYFLGQAFAAAGRQQLPVQVHTGFGDADLDLLQANPLLLRPALEAGAFAGAPVVLLHCYPYLREAGYLASLYADVYVDLSLSVPLLGPACQRAVAEALELAPATKVLYGSDAAGLAESVWLGAIAIRRALAAALGDWLRAGALTAAEAERLAERVLHVNARALYGL
ncbi:MAG TPA: amidohydrolase family protein [Chloroflexota bacterium]|nr:amidohydrolase family protein [Chloroflexota bacterium]